MPCPRRKRRLLTLIARVNAARGAIAGRYDETGDFAANAGFIGRQLILLGRRTRLLRAYLDHDPRRAPR